MSSQQSSTAGEGPGEAGAGAGQAGAGAGVQPSEEELRAAYEAELERITTAEVIMQTAVSLLNLGARRLHPPAGTPGAEAGTAGAGAGRDLEQVRDAIDAARALMGVLERRYPRELGPLRDALSQLQLAYARETRSGAAQPEADAAGAEAGAARSQESGAGPPAGAGAGSFGEAEPAGEGASKEQEKPGQGPGPAESSGRLWVPGR